MQKAEQTSAPATRPARPGHDAERASAHTPRRMPARIATLLTLLLEQSISLYAAAVLRIGYGFLYFAFLLREFPHRDEIWGPGSPWTPTLAKQLFVQTGWDSVLTLSD